MEGKDGVWIAITFTYIEHATSTWVSCLNLELFRVRLAFLCTNWVSGPLMCIIQIWTTSTCSSAPKLVKKNHMCVFGWIYRSHARNGNEIQTSGRRGSVEMIEKLGFLIPVNPKHGWKSWNLAWCHDMAPTCCSNFFWPNWDKLWCKLLANQSFPQEDSRNQEPSWGNLRFARSLHQRLSQFGQKNYCSMLVPCHDTMSSFIIFRHVFDL